MESRKLCSPLFSLLDILSPGPCLEDAVSFQRLSRLSRVSASPCPRQKAKNQRPMSFCLFLPKQNSRRTCSCAVPCLKLRSQKRQVCLLPPFTNLKIYMLLSNEMHYLLVACVGSFTKGRNHEFVSEWLATSLRHCSRILLGEKGQLPPPPHALSNENEDMSMPWS